MNWFTTLSRYVTFYYVYLIGFRGVIIVISTAQIISIVSLKASVHWGKLLLVESKVPLRKGKFKNCFKKTNTFNADYCIIWISLSAGLPCPPYVSCSPVSGRTEAWWSHSMAVHRAERPLSLQTGDLNEKKILVQCKCMCKWIWKGDLKSIYDRKIQLFTQ